MNNRRPYSMTSLDYKLLKGEWQNDNHMLYVDTAERCFEEGWLDRAGHVTQKGLIAVGLFETFNKDWQDEEFDDDIPWAGDSVLFLDHQKLNDNVAARPATTVVPTNDTTTPAVVAVRGSGHLAAPETEYA